MVSQREIQAQESRRRILAAARAEFSEKGFDAARVDEIARRAEVNKALIYYYFKSKDELLRELLRSFLEERRERLDDTLGRPESPLGSLAGQDLDFLLERREILRVVLMEELKAAAAPGSRGLLLDHWLEGLPAVRDAYARHGMDYRLTPRTLAAMYFFHLLPATSFAVFGEAFAERVGVPAESLREAFLRLSGELDRVHARDVFALSNLEDGPEAPLPGLVPRPPSRELRELFGRFREGERYREEDIAPELASGGQDPSATVERLVGLGWLRRLSDGSLVWCASPPPEAAPGPAPLPPQSHLDFAPSEREALLAKHVKDGRLARMPLKEKARVAVTEFASRLFRPDRLYSEREVDALLKGFAEDHARIRRYLVDYGYLHRTPDGSRYWSWDGKAP